MQINEHLLYSANAKQYNMDEVDEFIYNLQLLKEYEEVCKFITKKFGVIDKQKIFEYPEIEKQIEIVVKEDAIEFFAAKNWTQYFSRGWRLVKEDQETQEK